MVQSTVYEFISIVSEILPKEFNGKHQNLQSFIDCLDLLKTLTIENNEHIAVTLIKSRLNGLARHWVTNANSIDQIKEILLQNVSHESSKFVRALLRNTRQNKKKAQAYCDEIEQLTGRLEFAFIAEGVPFKIARKLAIEFAVESMSENANNIKVCTLLKIGNFDSLNDIFEKFIILSSKIDTPGITTNIVSNQENFKYNAKNQMKSNFHKNEKYIKTTCDTCLNSISILRNKFNHDTRKVTKVIREINARDYPRDKKQKLHDPKIIEVSNLRMIKKVPRMIFKINYEKCALQIILKQGKNVILDKYIHNIITNDKLEIEKLVKVIKCEASNLNIKKLQISSNDEIFKKSTINEIEKWGHILDSVKIFITPQIKKLNNKNIDEINYLLKKYHEIYSNKTKMLYELRKKYCWKNMSRDVAYHVQNCIECKSFEANIVKEEHMNNETKRKPVDHIPNLDQLKLKNMNFEKQVNDIKDQNIFQAKGNESFILVMILMIYSVMIQLIISIFVIRCLENTLPKKLYKYLNDEFEKKDLNQN